MRNLFSSQVWKRPRFNDGLELLLRLLRHLHMALTLRAASGRASTIASSLCKTFIRLSNLHEDGRAINYQTSRSHSRPRGPLWRGKKGIGKEALHVICDVKRSKQDSVKLGNVLQLKAARLLKSDLLAVLRELQRQHEVELALKVRERERETEQDR